MAEKNPDLKFKLKIHASIDETFNAFTNSTSLSEWLCSVAHIEARKGGRIYLWWENGFNVNGEFVKLIPGDRVIFSWHGKGEPGFTRVKVTFKPLEEMTQITLSHLDLGEDESWKKARKAFKRGWRLSLNNLKSVLETGQDLRYTERPMLGFTSMKALSTDEAVQSGFPQKTGMLVLGVMDGMCAHQVGLQAGDLLVRFAGEPVANLIDLNTLLNQYRAGDKVKLTYYRGANKIVKTGVLSRRPTPEIPAEIEGLAEAVSKMYERLDSEIDEILNDVDEKWINLGSSPTTYSIRETLGHLIANEREMHAMISRLIEGQEADFIIMSNQPVRVRATISAFPNLASLLAELKRNQAETIAMIAELPSEFIKRRRSYWRLAIELLQNPPLHYQEHLVLMCDIIKQARQAGSGLEEQDLSDRGNAIGIV